MCCFKHGRCTPFTSVSCVCDKWLFVGAAEEGEEAFAAETVAAAAQAIRQLCMNEPAKGQVSILELPLSQQQFDAMAEHINKLTCKHTLL